MEDQKPSAKTIGLYSMHLAASNGELQTVKDLINKGANLNNRDRNSYTPLHYALYGEHTEIAKTLIDQITNFNIQDKSGDTPLHASLYKKNTEIASILIEKEGINLDIKNLKGCTPLYYAISNPKLIKSLIKAGAKPTTGRSDQALRSKHFNDYIIIEFFKEAIKDNDLKIISNLLKNNSRLKNRKILNKTLLSFAIDNAEDKTIEHMIDKGFTLNGSFVEFIEFCLGIKFKFIKKEDGEIANETNNSATIKSPKNNKIDSQASHVKIDDIIV